MEDGCASERVQHDVAAVACIGITTTGTTTATIAVSDRSLHVAAADAQPHNFRLLDLQSACRCRWEVHMRWEGRVRGWVLWVPIELRMLRYCLGVDRRMDRVRAVRMRVAGAAARVQDIR